MKSFLCLLSLLSVSLSSNAFAGGLLVLKKCDAQADSSLIQSIDSFLQNHDKLLSNFESDIDRGAALAAVLGRPIPKISGPQKEAHCNSAKESLNYVHVTAQQLDPMLKSAWNALATLMYKNGNASACLHELWETRRIVTSPEFTTSLDTRYAAACAGTGK